MNDLNSSKLEAFEPETFTETALRTGRAVVVGHGISGHQVVYRLFSAARELSKPVRILWIADHHDTRIASFGSCGWHMPFLNGDPRVADWARRSFRRWRMLSELGLDEFLIRTESVFLTRAADQRLPEGHPGAAVAVDPVDFELLGGGCGWMTGPLFPRAR
ncbi:hypothetical protein ACWDSJ_35055 [Nocardia sp. NPDC003482]